MYTLNAKAKAKSKKKLNKYNSAHIDYYNRIGLLIFDFIWLSFDDGLARI